MLTQALVKSKIDTSGESQYAICRAFEKGIGISKNLFFHLPWCEEAAKYNHVVAPDRAGSAYMFGVGVVRDYKKAAAYLTRGALLGNKWAGYHLSQLYREGKGVSRDLDTAEVLAKEFVAHFYDKKSSGKTVTMYDYYEVATLYRDGFGVFKDRAKAREYFEKAKKLWHPQAADELSKLGK